MNTILDRIEDFCKAKNIGPAYKNGFDLTPRVRWVISLLKDLEIEFFVDRFFVEDVPMYNIVLPGKGKKMVIAHHDIANPKSENANDNSASVLNAIYLKQLVPEMHIVLTDGEECGQWGAKRLAELIKKRDIGEIDWVLNLELTGKGGKNIFVGKYKGGLAQKIHEKFDAPIISVPLNDCNALERAGINTTVINPLPLLTEGESDILSPAGFLDDSGLYDIHTSNDNLSKISVPEMKEFVEEILVPIAIDENI